MKLACSIAVIALTASPVLADEVAPLPPPNTFGIDGVAVLPFGNYADAVSFGAGAFGRIEVALGTGFVTGRIGVILHSVKDDLGMTSLTFIPIFAGYRHPIGSSGAYLAGELGLTIGYASADTGRFGSVSDSDSELGFTISAGVRRGALDLRGGLFAPDADDVQGFMASVGYDFVSF